MRFYNRQHRHYCGIDLHVKTMYVCILDAPARCSCTATCRRRRRRFSRSSAPYREDLVVAAECMFTWYWLADVCAAEGITFVLGHALAMKAIHGGKAKNDKIDSHKIAVPAARRAAAAGVCLPGGHAVDARSAPRRFHLVRKRGQLLAHIQNTRAQYNLPGLWAAARLSDQSRRRGRALSRSQCAEEHRRSTWR